MHLFVRPAPPAAPFSVRAVVITAFGVSSAIVALLAFAAFWRARTTINPFAPERARVLITTGVFQLTRNPLYLSLALLLFAYALKLGAPEAFLGPIVFVAYITRFQVLPEERTLAGKFGEEWRLYCKRTRRWI